MLQEMLQVRPGLLLGSRGDALAVLSRVPSVTKLYTVTHVLTLANEPLEMDDGDGVEGDSGDGKSDESCKEIGGKKRRRGPPMKTMFVKVADIPGSDLLHSFEPCIQFIKEGVEQGTVLVHWYAQTLTCIARLMRIGMYWLIFTWGTTRPSLIPRSVLPFGPGNEARLGQDQVLCIMVVFLI